MEFKSLIAQRRSIRKYSDRPVPRDVMDRMLAEALTAAGTPFRNADP